MANAINKGDKVLAQYPGDDSGEWYPGVVAAVRGEECRINYDDGDKAVVPTYMVKVTKARKQNISPKPGTPASSFDADALLADLSDDDYLSLLAAISARRPKSIPRGAIVKVAFQDGNIGYGICVGGGQTAKVWRVGEELFAAWPTPWANIIVTGDRAQVDPATKFPTEAEAKRLASKYL